MRSGWWRSSWSWSGWPQQAGCLTVPQFRRQAAWQLDAAFHPMWQSAWLALRTQSTVGGGRRRRVETAGRLAELPETSAALRAGALSELQTDDRIAVARNGSGRRRSRCSGAWRLKSGVKGLKDECARVEPRRRREIRRSGTLGCRRTGICAASADL